MSAVQDPATLEPLLVPAPRRLSRRDGFARAAPLRRELEPGLPAEGYRLRVAPEGVTISAAGPDGLARGDATLRQLERQYGEHLPCLDIEDAPALARRGWMLDTSRDRVPTWERLRELARLLASLKLNEFELYTEHSFAYSGHEVVWRDASPVTADELRALDSECDRRGVDLIANQNCFGHFERWLRHPDYAALAETHDRFRFEGIELEGPFSLCPVDPRSLDLVRGLLDQQLPCVSSRSVNIGCDETQDVGQGRSRAAVAQRGSFDVYAQYVSSVAEHAVARGFEPRFWADIALRAPERVGELNRALIPIAWGYEAEHPFDRQAQLLAAAGRPFHLACGSSAWRSFTGRTSERRGNLEACLAAARSHGARGVMLTEWGDLGHRQVPQIGELALAEFAARAWNPDAPLDERAVSLQVFGDRTLRVAAWIAELGDLDRELRRASSLPRRDGSAGPLTNASALFEALHPSGFPFRLPEDPTDWRAALERLHGLRGRRPAIAAPIGASLEHACDQAELALRVAIARRSIGVVDDLRELLEHVRSGQRRLWAADSRPGGLEDSLEHWNRALT
jgi:hexosaminidase